MPQPRTPERKSDPANPQPWRVEGRPEKGSGKPPMVPRSRRIWTFIAIALIVNLALSAVLSRPESRMTVPYTFVRTQVEEGKVKDVLLDKVRAGITVIMTTHILEVAERMAERIGVIAHGRLIAEGTLAELRAHARGGTTLEDIFLELVAEGATAA